MWTVSGCDLTWMRILEDSFHAFNLMPLSGTENKVCVCVCPLEDNSCFFMIQRKEQRVKSTREWKEKKGMFSAGAGYFASVSGPFPTFMRQAKTQGLQRRKDVGWSISAKE